MKKLLFLIPFMLVFISACGDIDQSLSKKTPEDNSINQPINPDDNNNNGGQTNPGGDGEGGTTVDPEPGGDGEGGTTTDPEPGGDGEGGTITDPNPGGDGDGGTTTDPNPGGDGDGGTTVDPEPGGDGEGGTTTDPNPDGDGEGGTTVDPNPGGDGEGGTTTDPEPGGDGDGGTTVDPNPGGDGEGGETTDPENPADKPAYDRNFNASIDVFQPQFYYGRSLLSDEEQKAYDLLMKTFVEFEVTEANKNNTRIGANFKNNGIRVTYNQLIKIVKYILYDEQRLTYLITSTVPRGTATGAPNRPQESGGFVVEAYFDVMGNMLSTARQIYDTNTPKIEDGVVKILSKLQNDMTEAQKFRVLHDAFLNNIRYSQSGFGVDNIVGGFVNHAVLCEGYARSLAYLCQRAGLEVIYIEGYATYSGTGSDGSDAFDHAWIKVKIDGQWYNVDPTNNSGGALVGASGVTYTNFLMNDDEFNIDHTAGLLSDKTTPTSYYGNFPPSAEHSYPFDMTEYSK